MRRSGRKRSKNNAARVTRSLKKPGIRPWMPFGPPAFETLRSSG